MKILNLTNLKKPIILDDEDFERVSKYNWGAYGSHTLRISSTSKINGKHISLASFIMNTNDIMYDHKDRDPFNNQKENLRFTSHRLNRGNTTKDNFNHKVTSIYKGVSWHKTTKKWYACITYHGSQISLGYYHDEINAALAYDKAALKYFGEFAVFNFQKE